MDAHVRTLDASKAMAFTAWHFLSDDKLAHDVKSAFESQKALRLAAAAAAAA